MKTKHILAPITVKEGSFEVIASTDIFDREGESILQDGWELDNYKKNPVILFGHKSDELPIGFATDVAVVDGKLTIKGEFADKEANPLAEQIRLLHEAGILKTVSVGFIPLERDGDIIKRAELLELSFVAVPANPEALALVKHKGLDMRLVEKEKSEVADDTPKKSYYNKKRFFRIMKNKRNKDEHNIEDVEAVVEKSLMEAGTELKSEIEQEIKSAVPDLEAAADKQMGEEIIDELIKDVDEVIEKNLQSEVAPLATEIEETVADATEVGEKQGEDEVAVVVEKSLEAVADDIMKDVSDLVETAAADLVELMDEEARQEGEESVAEVVDILEKNIAEIVEDVLMKQVDPLAAEATEAADSATAGGGRDDDEKGGHEDEDDDKVDDEDDDEKKN